MCKLYTQLSKLVVWLGIDDDPEIKFATGLIKLNANAKKEGQESLRMVQKALASRFQETGFNYTVYVGKFLSRPWFFRSWIVQEYVLGSQKCIVVFKYGSLQLSRDDMEALRELSQWDWVPQWPSKRQFRQMPNLLLADDGGPLFTLPVLSFSLEEAKRAGWKPPSTFYTSYQ